MDNSKHEVLQAIREKKQIDEDVKRQLTDALKEFKGRFQGKREEKLPVQSSGSQNGAARARQPEPVTQA